MATMTPNLGLSKPEVTDKLVDSLYDFNGNADLLDALIGRLSDLNTAQKDSLVAAINEAAKGGGMGITGATVGQIAKITAVDENGVPTKWEAADLPSEWEVINEVTTTEDLSALVISTDKDGNAFDLDEIRVFLRAQNVNSGNFYFYINSSSFSATLDSVANWSVALRYRKGTGSFFIASYQYGISFVTEKCESEPIDSEGNFIPQTIDRFRFANFDGVTMPAGTHIIITGKRAKT